MKALIVVSNRFWELALKEVVGNCGFDVEAVSHSEILDGFWKSDPDLIIVCEYEPLSSESYPAGREVYSLLERIISAHQMLIGAGFLENNDEGIKFLRMPFAEKELKEML